jgi:predicted NBD/HSP70 family sugar kinase
VGVGIVINGELLRGHDYIAGEFGHVPLSIDGPQCMCGARGCWEAYASNLAILSRYFGRDVSKLRPQGLRSLEQHPFGIVELIGRARAGDGKAVAALETSARYLGLGLASIVNAINPDCIYLSGEITTGWDMIESIVRKSLSERALTSGGARAALRLTSAQDYPRLKGAAALIAAPAFAAPRVA